MVTCVLCAARGRQTRIESGLVCPACSVRVTDTLDDIVRLAAAASIEPAAGRGSGRTIPASRPPLNIDAVDPALVLVRVAPPPAEPVPLLVLVEQWVKLIREERRMAPYGQWSAVATRTGPGGYCDTSVTLTACIAFLRAQHGFAIAQDWIDSYADEIASGRRALLKFDPDREPGGWRIPCPSPDAEGDCGYPLLVRRVDADELVTCRRCGRQWATDRLLLVAGRDADAWLDPEAASTYTGVPQSTMRRWAAAGAIRRDHGRYSLSDVRAAATARRA